MYVTPSTEAYISLLRFVDRAPQHNRVKKNQLDAQLILSIFRHPLHVSGVSRSIIERYNRLYTTIGTYYSFRRLTVVPKHVQADEIY